jgi:hypothetical protein
MTLTRPRIHAEQLSRPACAGAALILLGALFPTTGSVMAPFGLALAIAPFFRRGGRLRGHTRAVVQDLAMIALFGSAAAAAVVLWPVIGRDPARFSQLLSDLWHRGPELWGNARVKSPPEIINTLQGCVQPDRISQLPMQAAPVARAQTGFVVGAFAVLLEWSGAREACFAFTGRTHWRAPDAVGFEPLLLAHGRSPPWIVCTA